jgi:hypothetical protein
MLLGFVDNESHKRSQALRGLSSANKRTSSIFLFVWVKWFTLHKTSVEYTLISMKVGDKSVETSAVFGKNFTVSERRERMPVLSLKHTHAERAHMFRFFPDWHEYCTDS